VDAHLVSLLAPASLAAEQYRNLRNVVEQLRGTARGTIVGITSPATGDGKTVTALNLAGSLAQAPDARVLLVDADLRRPSVQRYLGLDGDRRPDLTQLILNPGLKLAQGVTTCQPFGLAVLLTAGAPAAPYEILKSSRLAEVLEEARMAYNYVVLDTPPLIPVPDCRVIGECVDGFFVVVTAHRTPRKLVEEAVRGMEPHKMLGLVFNEDDGPPPRYYPPYTISRNGDEGAGRRRRWMRSVFGVARSSPSE
jgi:capsular exopolysaccharide synthesis family protein